MPNYSIFSEHQWYFAKEVLNIIKDYMNRFPTVTNQILNSKFEINYKDLFPMGDPDEQLEELLDYLR